MASLNAHQNTNLSLEGELYDVYEALEGQLHILEEKMIDFQVAEQNNEQMRMASADPDVIKLQKMRFTIVLNEIISQLSPLELPRSKALLCCDVAKLLKEEISNTEELIASQQRILQERKNEISRLKQRVDNLKMIIDSGSKRREEEDTGEFERVNSQLEREFARTKKTLNIILNRLFPGSGMKELVADLYVEYFNEEGDGYVRLVGDKHYPYYCVEAVLSSNIAVRHPYDRNKIKMAAFRN